MFGNLTLARYRVEASFMEIYMERVQDMLSGKVRGHLRAPSFRFPLHCSCSDTRIHMVYFTIPLPNYVRVLALPQSEAGTKAEYLKVREHAALGP
jgi:hypothetical protein